MNKALPIFFFIIVLALTACAQVTEQTMIDVIGTTGPFETHPHTLVPISTDIHQENFTSVLLPVPHIQIFVPMTGAASDGSVVMMVFASPQEAHTVATELIAERSLPPLDVGDQAWMGIVSEIPEQHLTAYQLIIQRCQGVAVVSMSKLPASPADTDHLRMYAQALDARMHAALCP